MTQQTTHSNAFRIFVIISGKKLITIFQNPINNNIRETLFVSRRKFKVQLSSMTLL